jgi:hypothetical protein
LQIKLDIDQKKILKGFADIQKANKIAMKNTLTTIAFLTRKNALKNINDNNKNEA